MTQRPEFVRPDFEEGEYWMYETRCRKCGNAYLRRWGERKVQSWSVFLREVMTRFGDGLMVEGCTRCGINTVQDIVALSPHPMAKEPGCTVEPSKGEGPRPGGQAHGAEPGNTKAMGRSTEHNLIINAKHLAALLEKTTGTTIEVRPVKNYPNGGNSALLIDEMGIGVNSDEPFTYNLSHTQRAHLNNLLIVVGDQPVNIRFNLRSRYVEVSGVLV